MANEFIARKGLIALEDSQITGSLDVSGSITLEGSGSTLFNIVGSEGQLFSITDSLSGSLFAVSDISGLPILEVFSDDTVKIGSFNNEAIIVSGSNATITGSFTGSFTGDGSNLTNTPAGDPFPYTGDVEITGSNSLSGNYALKVTNTSGDNILNVENDGNIGIGTSNPSSMLEVGTSTNPGKIEIKGKSNNGVGTDADCPTLILDGTWHSAAKLTIGVGLGNNQYSAVFNANNSYKFQIGGSNVFTLSGGMTAPLTLGSNLLNLGGGIIGTGITLRLAENIQTFQHTGFVYDWLEWTGGTSTGQGYTFHTYTHKNLLALNGSTGRVGIGTSSPTAMLHVTGAIYTETNITASGHVSASTYYGDGSNLTDTDPFPYTGDAVITGSNSLSGNYALKVTNTSGDDILNVENDGNVGIGIDNPTEKLHVHDGIIHISDSSTNNYIDIEPDVSGAPRLRFFDAGAVDYRLTFNSSRFSFNSGIEITSGHFELTSTDTILSDGKLQLRGTDTYVNFVDAGAAFRGAIGFLDSDSNFIYTQGGSTLANGTEQFRIASSGNVGIGVTNPQTNLHVSSSVSASTYYGDGSNLTDIPSDFPYTGSAIISGSLEVTGSTKILAPNSLTGNYNFQLATPQGWQFRAENDGNIRMGARGNEYVKWDFNAGNRVLNLNNFLIQGTSVYDLSFQAGTNANINFGAKSFNFGNSYNQGKAILSIRQSNTNFPNSEVNTLGFNQTINHIQPYTVIQTNDNSYGSNTTPQGHPLYLYAGQNTSTGVFGHVILQSSPQNGKKGNVGIGLEDPQTNLHVSSSISASTYYGDGSNLTGISSDPFPYTGSAIISGSLEVIGDITGSSSILKVSEIASSIGDAASAGDLGINAETVTFYSDTVVAGYVYYLGASAWASSDADAVSTSKGFMGVATSTNSNTGMVIRGIVYLGADPGGSVGDVVYLSTATGRLTTDISGFGAGDVARVMGYKVGTSLVFFDPSPDWIELDS